MKPSDRVTVVNRNLIRTYLTANREGLAKNVAKENVGR